ncbi:glucose dehydrogenase [Xylariaceae sp. FL0016]|nr:glucose dehydrogenase [Xylariaceae sp. FL0016]
MPRNIIANPLRLWSLGLAAAAASPLSSRQSSSYDYIIVGGGTAGMVVANRLSEDSEVSVLVVEAGPYAQDNPTVQQPEGLLIFSEWDWAYSTTPQTYNNNNTGYIGGGKALGGTSAINGMSYGRSQAAVIDAWETLGNEGWSWADLEPSYIKSTSISPPTESQMSIGGVTWDPELYSADGPLVLGWRNSSYNEDILVPLVNETFANLGLPYNFDSESGDMVGLSNPPTEVNPVLNMRDDSARAYYLPIREARSNLVVMTNTEVSRIRWSSDTENGMVKANGVELAATSNTTSSTIEAKREVILCAGAIKSPMLLELSGVGREEILNQHGIDVVVDLPGVGENLQDNANIAFSYTAADNFTDTAYPFAWLTLGDIMSDEDAQTLSNRVSQNISAYAEVQAALTGNSISASVWSEIFTLQHDLIFKSAIPAMQMGTGVTDNVLSSRGWVSACFSRGNVHISTNSTASPAINPAYLMHGADLEILAAISRFIRTLYAQEPLASAVTEETSPGFGTVSDDEWPAYLVSAAGGNSHVIGSNAMMPREKGGVVDTEGKVYGTANVRVIDGSIIPFMMSGPPTATIYAIAEKLSEAIKSSSS